VAKTLAEYAAPPLDDAVDAALVDYIARRKSSMEDMWY
jgi:trimethylamine--corrinoid protein Co-methyltransferase